MVLGLFKRKKKGCLEGKTEQQKIDFFKSLAQFATTDKQFFEEQYMDLLFEEQREFHAWVIKDGEQKQTIKSLLNIIEELSK